MIWTANFAYAEGLITGEEFIPESNQLVYAKNGTLRLIKKIYYSDTVVCLKRKRFKIERALGIINKQAGVEKLEYSLP